MKQVFQKQIKIGALFLTTLVLSSSFALAGFDNVDCVKNQKILAISVAECQVLEKLWDSAGGKDWQNNENWDSITNVDSWEGVIVENAKISSLLLYSNNLVGTIPSELGKLSSLKKLSLSNNSLTGKVPESLGELSELHYLDLGNNNLNGVIPIPLGSLLHLTELYLNNNQFSGSIPDSLGDLQSLNVLKMYGNSFSGSIPLTFGALSNLDILSLAENSLMGAIPSELGELTKLSYLDLKSNKLSGSIPARLGNLVSLTGLYLQKNKLTGDIPSELGNLSNLTDLDLSDNKLSGAVPASLGNLTTLTYLNVANNQLSGDVPSELLNLTRMNYLNIKENKFVFSNIEPLYEDLLGIPAFIISPKLIEDNTSTGDVINNDNSLVEKQIPITIKVLSEEEIATLEMATLKIVGTEEAGDSLLVENEGTWSIEDDKIIFMPLEGFNGTPKSISYTIENNDGVESNPIEISVKRNKTEALTVNILENEKRDLEVYSIEISLSESFLEQHPESILSKDRKELIVDSEGVWKVENNGTVTFSPEEDFIGEASHIEYLVFADSGNKFAVGMIDMKHKLSAEEEGSETNMVALFGVKGLLLMILFGGLLGMFYIREIENKKV